MDTDLAGRVRNTPLAYRNGLLPVFEAIVNSITAIQESKTNDGRIIIRLQRSSSLLQPADAHGNYRIPVESFEIEDNGIGFTHENYKSFNTMDSQAKAHLGGKGIGRIFWLKAFDHAKIESIYKENDTWYYRKFLFKPTTDGIEDHIVEPQITESNGSRPRTTVRLNSFKPQYRERVVRSAEAIARKIVEHCMAYFVLGNCPTIVVEDPSSEISINLKDVFTTEYEPVSEMRSFKIEGGALGDSYASLRRS